MQSGRPSIDLPELESVRRLRESGRMMEGGPGSGPRKGQSRNRGETKPKFSKGTKRVPEPTLSQQIKSGNTNVKAMKSLVQAAGFKRDPDNDGDYDKAFSHKNGTSMHLEHGGWTHVVNEDGDIGGEGSDAKSLKDYIRVPEPTLSQQIKSGNTNVKAMKSLVQAAGFKRDPDNDGDYDKAFSHKNGTSMHLEHGGWTHVVNEDGDIGGEGSDAKSLKDYIRKGFRGHEREQD